MCSQRGVSTILISEERTVLRVRLDRAGASFARPEVQDGREGVTIVATNSSQRKVPLAVEGNSHSSRSNVRRNG